MGAVESFGDMLRNFWQPLFDAAAAADPDDPTYWILDKIRVLDTVDDESIEDAADLAGLPAADAWTSEANPPYAYYLYYMHENLARLNGVLLEKKIREAPLHIKPHAGEAGPSHHLASAFLFSDGVSHGINLVRFVSFLPLSTTTRPRRRCATTPSRSSTSTTSRSSRYPCRPSPTRSSSSSARPRPSRERSRSR